MKRKYILGVILAVALLAALVYSQGGGHAPPGQSPLESLTPQSVDDVKNAFNVSKQDVRLLVLLSPT